MILLWRYDLVVKPKIRKTIVKVPSFVLNLHNISLYNCNQPTISNN